MTLEKLRLKLDRDADGTVERTYDIYPVDNIDISSTKEAFSVAPPGLSSRENILLGVSGQQADITVNFWTWDDSGADRANGTHTSTVETPIEQNRYLEDVMHDPGFDAAWQLDHLTGDAFNDDEVFVETVDVISLSTENRKWKPATLRLRRGGSV